MVFFALGLILCPSLLLAQENWLKAPNLDRHPAVNQHKAGINACGPACILDAYQIASDRWLKSLRPYQKFQTDEKKIDLLIRRHGLKRSLRFSNDIRWNKYKGVNAADLAAMANEMRRGFTLPQLKYQEFFRKEKETHHDLMARIHRSFKKSMKAGFPPIVSIRRVANRKIPRGGGRMWMTLQGHFVLITGFPKSIAATDEAMVVSYRDPWTGRDHMGRIRFPKSTFWAAPSVHKNGRVYKNPTLVADFPSSRIGIKKVRKGEQHALTLASGIGAF